MDSQLLDAEIHRVCAKMLEMDERNFHCWNYRLWVVDLYLKEKEKRANLWEISDLYEKQAPLIESECVMALGMIKKNFSNFSAWHYRSKLMPLLHNKNGTAVNHLDYVIPLTTIEEDLAMLKHAFFTDPKDQSPWNYHEWLLQQVTPVQVEKITFEENAIVV